MRRKKRKEEKRGEKRRNEENENEKAQRGGGDARRGCVTRDGVGDDGGVAVLRGHVLHTQVLLQQRLTCNELRLHTTIHIHTHAHTHTHTQQTSVVG